jgi:hypothetical protein
MKMNKRTSVVLGAILLLISGAAFAALPPRVSWNPEKLNPASIVPGSSASFSVVLKHTGILPIAATNQLKVLPSAELLPYTTVTPPSFPPVLKRGDSVNINITVSVPQGTPLSVVKGNLTLSRVLPNGTVKEVWRADALSAELTFSPFFIPPAPDKALDESTIEGVDSDTNGVPDRADRFIAFTAPESEKKRAAMTLSAKAQQDFFIDYLDHLGEDPNDPVVVARVRGMADLSAKALYCRMYVFGVHITLPGNDEIFDTYSKNSREIEAQFMDTPERIRAFWQSERPLVATGAPDVPDEQFKQQCLDLGLDPDSLPN